MITLSQLAEQAGIDASTLRRDIQNGLMKADLFGKTYLVDSAEARRWLREILPQHLRNRRKPPGATAKSRRTRTRR